MRTPFGSTGELPDAGCSARDLSQKLGWFRRWRGLRGVEANQDSRKKTEVCKFHCMECKG